jgi:hypothetical protein
MLKNEITIVTLLTLLIFGLTGVAFASGTDSSELDASDYAEGHVFDTSQLVDRSYRPEVEQNKILVSAFAGGTDSSELDKSDYAEDHVFRTSQQVDRSYRPEVEQVAQYKAWASDFASGTGSNELDASDYALENSGFKDSMMCTLC